MQMEPVGLSTPTARCITSCILSWYSSQEPEQLRCARCEVNPALLYCCSQAAVLKCEPLLAQAAGSGGGDWTNASGRPTVGDHVRLKVSKEGLSPGDICEVMSDDHDGNPYKLKKVGTSSTKSYFTEEQVQKVTPVRTRVLNIFASQLSSYS